eukprot:1158777-Pelagomonas_calceolata.AAC.1
MRDFCVEICCASLLLAGHPLSSCPTSTAAHSARVQPGLKRLAARCQGRRQLIHVFSGVSVTLHATEAKGVAEGTVGTIATLVGGLLGIGVLAYLAATS